MNVAPQNVTYWPPNWPFDHSICLGWFVDLAPVCRCQSPMLCACTRLHKGADSSPAFGFLSPLPASLLASHLANCDFRNFLRIPAHAITIRYEIIGQGNILLPPRAKPFLNSCLAIGLLRLFYLFNSRGNWLTIMFVSQLDILITELWLSWSHSVMTTWSALLCCCIKCKMSA